MKPIVLLLLSLCLTPGCRAATPAPLPAESRQGAAQKTTLVEARHDHAPKLVRREAGTEPVPAPPKALFRTVYYKSDVGKLAAYLSQSPQDGKKHPAIIWVFGGFGNDLGGTAWRQASPDNDQSASAFRKAGIVTMYPSFRGGNRNPGIREDFFGEVDDVIAAADFLAKQDFVDPKRIYLGGHSTGGTMAMLVAECSDRFRAVFAFGPVANAAAYGQDRVVFDTTNEKEVELRAPILWLHCIKNPTFVFEGMEGGNVDSLDLMAQASENPRIQFCKVQGATHFSTLAPITQLIAQRILKDTEAKSNVAFSEDELNAFFARR